MIMWLKSAAGLFVDWLDSCHKQRKKNALRNALGAIGKNTKTPLCEISYPERVFIGEDVHIESGAVFQARGGVVIEDYSILGPEVVVISVMHNYLSPFATMIPYDGIELLRRVVIRRACWIGMRAIIMPGVELGEGCIVAAGSVVTKSWPRGSVIGGNPAKLIRTREPEHLQDCFNRQQFYMKLKREGFVKKEESPCFDADRIRA